MLVQIKKVKNGWLLFNDCGGYERHSHFKNEKAARACLNLINKGIMPKQPYFIETCKRVLSKKEFERLESKRRKEKYININKGKRNSK